MMRKRCTILMSAFCLFLHFSKAMKPREFDRKLERASALFGEGNYPDALNLYLELYKVDSSNYMLNYFTGTCYLKGGRETRRAIMYLERSVNYYSSSRIQDPKLPKQVYKYLGEAYHQAMDFENAIENYLIYKSLEMKSISSAASEQIDRKIQMSRNGKELISDPVQVQISNMGSAINSRFEDYAPKISADQCTMIYTSCRPKDERETDEGAKYFEDIYLSNRLNQESSWRVAESLGLPLNSNDNDAALYISADAKEILIYKDDKGDGNIYSSKLIGNKWSQPEKLNANINSQYWEPCAFIAEDGKTLYFVSDRPGGFGGTDIYKSERCGNDWGPAVNLGPAVNTKYDEYSPFMHSDGTLYFSSKGHNSMGGYDVFFSRTMTGNPKQWLKATNMGFPINSPGDDAFYILSSDRKTAWYSSLREGGYGAKDNYMIRYPEEPELPPASLSGAEESPVNYSNMVISVLDQETGEIAGVYHPNVKSGKFQIFLSPGSQKISVLNGNVDCSQSGAGLEKEESSLILDNIYFDFDEFQLKPESRKDLDKVAEFLKLNPKVKLKVSGYTDCKGKEAYNDKLSLNRAAAIVNYLVSIGVKGDRLTATGCGKCVYEEAKNCKNVKYSPESRARKAELRILALK